MGWTVYIVRCADRSLYTGISTDLEKRLARHAMGKASKYTRSRLPVRLVWSAAARSESAARKKEAAIKRLTKERKEALVRRR